MRKSQRIRCSCWCHAPVCTKWPRASTVKGYSRLSSGSALLRDILTRKGDTRPRERTEQPRAHEITERSHHHSIHQASAGVFKIGTFNKMQNIATTTLVFLGTKGGERSQLRKQVNRRGPSRPSRRCHRILSQRIPRLAGLDSRNGIRYHWRQQDCCAGRKAYDAPHLPQDQMAACVRVEVAECRYGDPPPRNVVGRMLGRRHRLRPQIKSPAGPRTDKRTSEGRMSREEGVGLGARDGKSLRGERSKQF
jgi:hypothetical protein